MPDSSFTFEEGDPIFVGSHGDHDYVFEEGEPVADNGQSTLVFESGTGLGGDTDKIRATMFDAQGNQVDQITITDGARDTGGIGFDSGYQGDGNSWDYVRTVDANGNEENLIDSFEDGDISEYTGDTTDYQVRTNRAKDGSYSLYVDPSPTNFRSIESQSGLNYYPVRGDNFRFWLYTEGGTDRVAKVNFGVGSSQNYSVGHGDVGQFQLAGPNDSTTGTTINQSGEWWEFLVEWGTV